MHAKLLGIELLQIKDTEATLAHVSELSLYSDIFGFGNWEGMQTHWFLD